MRGTVLSFDCPYNDNHCRLMLLSLRVWRVDGFLSFVNKIPVKLILMKMNRDLEKQVSMTYTEGEA